MKPLHTYAILILILIWGMTEVRGQVSIVITPKAQPSIEKSGDSDTTKYGWPADPFAGNWAKSILFSTDNPWGAGHLDWGFGKDSINMGTTIGGSVFENGKTIKTIYFKTKPPVVKWEASAWILYEFDSKKGPILIEYDSAKGDWNKLYYKGISLNIYDVMHFW